MIITKDAREIALMKKAGRIVGLVHKALRDFIQPGVTTRQIDEFCHKLILEKGATPSFLNLYGFPNSVCTSVNECVVHGIPNDIPLKEGDIVSVDIGACYMGYHGDSAWTYAVGEVDSKTKYLMEACEQSLYMGLKEVKPGNRIGDISYAIESYLTQKGLTTPVEFTGHGIGTKVHEDPSVPNIGTKGKGPRIKEGMCLAIEPMAHLGKQTIKILGPDQWNAITKDGSLAAHYEHTIVVTKTGYEITTIQD